AALTRAVSDLEKAIATYRDGEAGLSAYYAPDIIARIPVDDLDRDWREASAAMWPKSWLAARRIRRLLGSYANVKTANPATDLALLRKLQATHRAIEHNAVAGVPLAFAGLDTDCQALTQHLQTAERLRTSLDDRFHETCVMELMIWWRIPRLRWAKRGAGSWQDGGE
ncbi:MAG TPA: hypothetical protein VKD04_08435, partial [Burkholderiales bacterium]|nr:hypothetical protein [Burkholderiales bacterium]